MRMDRDQELDAATIVNTYGEEEIKKIIREYGEENGPQGSPHSS